ncbi:MAG: beta-glucosidase [Deltaproteobacteria bacterium]|nr:MAG: beta-glucosidase [Deltaproteobacteria bacterium]TDJ05260.1 MAG: beta-glucosidase [Deltaproteobacteria bacterium]
MTLEEKLAQLGGVWGLSLTDAGRFSETKAKDLLRHGIGHIARLAGASVLTPRESASLANVLQRFLRESTRLGIPAIVHEESCAGYSARAATCFPQVIGIASTWEPQLVEEMARVIRSQMRAVGAHQALAPVLDVARDPRWGRTEETFGEDPYLVARMGTAYVRGLQGDSLRSGIVGTGKHFVGYGAPEGGLNWAPAPLPRRELLERFVPPFAAAIHEAGLASVMNAYHEIDGVPCGASRELLDGLLRTQLGFDGVVVSDYFTLQTLVSYHHVAENESEAARRGLEAGIDLELPVLAYYGEPLRQAIESGRVPLAWVDRSVARVLRMKFELGLFEQALVDADAAPAHFDTPTQRELARRIALKSIVLLQNRGELLPLDPGLGRIAVIGPCADSARLMQGDYHYPTHLEVLSKTGPPGAADELTLDELFVPMVTVLDGIRAAVTDGCEVHSARGCEILTDSTRDFEEAVELARGADVAIVVVGGRSGLVEGCTSGEFCDRAELGLFGVQTELVLAVVATGTPTVVVLINGRPLALSRLVDDVPALLEAWLPGEEGGHAIADVLFGRSSPAGRLPVTLPRAVGQLPLYYNHKPSGARSPLHGDYVDLSTQPLFPFGHGLSYTHFEYKDLQLGARELPATGTLEISLDVTNAGERAGEEVVQLYVRDRVASLTRPVKELKGFLRLGLEPGETRTAVFELDLGQLAFYDADMVFLVEPGTVEIMLGSSSEAIWLRGEIEITGPPRRLRSIDVAPTRVRVR